MIQILIIGIILVIVGLIFIFYSKEMYAVLDSWKSRGNTEASNLYIVGKRVFGICFIVLGAICIIFNTVYTVKNSHWDAAYVTESSDANYWEFKKDGTLNCYEGYHNGIYEDVTSHHYKVKPQQNVIRIDKRNYSYGLHINFTEDDTMYDELIIYFDDGEVVLEEVE